MSKDFSKPGSPPSSPPPGAKRALRRRPWSATGFGLLAALLLAVYGGSFANPPRSDYWSAFYTFHSVRVDPGAGLGMLFNYDPFGHGTYRPIFYVFLFLEHSLFGDWFTGNRLVSFGAYLTVVALLYLAARRVFSCSRAAALAFCGLYAGLFNHFDIITWTFHLPSLLAFGAFLGGGILLQRYIRRKAGPAALGAAGALFLAGILSYEVFALWPLAAPATVFLVAEGSRKDKIRRALPAGLMTLTVYAVYFGGLALSRSSSAYMGRLVVPSSLGFLVSAAAPFFNFFYNSLAVNLVPVIAIPATLGDNVDLGGLLLNWLSGLHLKILWTGAAGSVLIGGGLLLLKRSGRERTATKLALLGYLYFTYFFTVMAARLTTNLLTYPFTQFRYQFVPNALAALAAAVLVSDLLRPRKREKVILALGLVPILAANLFLSRTYSNLIGQQLKPLKTMLNNVRRGLDEGVFIPEAKLYIDPRVTETMPALCWNKTMARFGMVQGTYEWLFTGENRNALADRPEDAAWVIRGDRPDAVYRLDRGPFGNPGP